MNNEYEGGWITTFSGRKFHYLDPQPEEIDIRDIAHHLSLICRFTGATRSFYSVAEHSCRVADIAPDGLKLSALLHDAAEAYIGDLSRPVKYSHRLDETETIILRAIANKYHVDPFDPYIHRLDGILLATEARDLMRNTDDWAELPPPLIPVIVPVSSRVAELSFLSRFKLWGGEYEEEAVPILS